MFSYRASTNNYTLLNAPAWKELLSINKSSKKIIIIVIIQLQLWQKCTVHSSSCCLSATTCFSNIHPSCQHVPPLYFIFFYCPLPHFTSLIPSQLSMFVLRLIKLGRKSGVHFMTTEKRFLTSNSASFVTASQPVWPYEASSSLQFLWMQIQHFASLLLSCNKLNIILIIIIFE